MGSGLYSRRYWQHNLLCTFFFTFSIIFIFLVNWTFVLVVSVISSPFNDFISERVEKIKTESSDNSLNSLQNLLKDVFKTLFYEIKKVLFILFISLFVVLIDLFIPLLAPIGLFLSSLLMSSQLLDYSWSRHQYSLKECLTKLKSEWLIYSLSGFIFMILFSIPIFNLIFLPIGVVYYTLLFCEGRKVMPLTNQS